MRRTLVIGKELEIRRALSRSHLYSSAFVVETEVGEGDFPQSFTLIGAALLAVVGAALLGQVHDNFLWAVVGFPLTFFAFWLAGGRVSEEPTYTRDFSAPDIRSNANALRVYFRDGTSTDRIEVAFPVGHPKRRDEAIQFNRERLR